MTQHYAMLQRNLLYTGVTRGKRLVVLVGQTKSVGEHIRAHRMYRGKDGDLARAQNGGQVRPRGVDRKWWGEHYPDFDVADR
jgi:ATP-dependent exoDNAse (exonuclease V) alpha subunit